MAEVIMVVGGSSSGKSLYAEQLVSEWQKRLNYKVCYIATGTIWDEEFRERVNKHRARRPTTWLTIEEPCELHQVLAHTRYKPGVFLVDGIGTWIANLMYHNNSNNFIWGPEKQNEFEEYVNLFIDALDKAEGIVVIVADEVGMDVVPASMEGRIFRDLNGLANQKLAARAEGVYLVVCGLSVKVK